MFFARSARKTEGKRDKAAVFLTVAFGKKPFKKHFHSPIPAVTDLAAQNFSAGSSFWLAGV